MTADTFRIGQLCHTRVGDREVFVVIVDIRDPDTLANWTSADQSKRVYKVRPAAALCSSRKYLVRQAHQLYT